MSDGMSDNCGMRSEASANNYADPTPQQQMEARARDCLTKLQQQFGSSTAPRGLVVRAENVVTAMCTFALREIEAQNRQEATRCDRHWLSGLRYGWNMGQLNDRAAYIEAQECREREIRASHPNPSPPGRENESDS